MSIHHSLKIFSENFIYIPRFTLAFSKFYSILSRFLPFKSVIVIVNTVYATRPSVPSLFTIYIGENFLDNTGVILNGFFFLSFILDLKSHELGGFFR